MPAKKQAIQLLKKLTNAHSAPGFEGAVRGVFCEELKSFKLESDRMGSVIAHHGNGSGPRIGLFGHMDEVGFMVQNISDEGFIQFSTLGGWWGHTLLSQRVRILNRKNEEHLGVICSIPVHFLPDGARDKVIKIDRMYIDVGAESKKDVIENYGINLGDSIVPDSNFTALANSDKFVAKAFDNRVGMGLAIQGLLSVADSKLPNRLFSVGAVQEEVGSRGATTVSQLIKPDLAFILEGPPADDSPGFHRSESQGKLGGGVQIRLFDPSAIMNHKLSDFVINCAKRHGISHQVTVRRSGGTDARAVQRYHMGVPVTVLGVPARYIHTHNSIIDINDYLAALNLIKKLLIELDQDTVDTFTQFID